MNITLSRWAAGVGATLLLVPILAACGDAPTTSPRASAPTSAAVPTSAPAAPARGASTSTPAPTDLSKVAPKPFDQRMQDDHDDGQRG